MLKPKTAVKIDIRGSILDLTRQIEAEKQNSTVRISNLYKRIARLQKRCKHVRTSYHEGWADLDGYTVCLDCGKQW